MRLIKETFAENENDTTFSFSDGKVLSLIDITDIGLRGLPREYREAIVDAWSAEITGDCFTNTKEIDGTITLIYDW